MIVDLRSDTVTRPTPAMRAAMGAAEVNDDVIDVDPTVDRLQRRTAELLGKEAALYVPSGTMSNQIALRVHCRPGDEFLCEEGCHIYNYEQGAFAQLSGLVARTFRGERGLLRADQLVDAIRRVDEHQVRTRLVCLENTHNRGGGSIQPPGEVQAILGWAREHRLATHLDGARLFNAAVATGCSLEQLATGFDTVSVCFSKGLGAPVGSALAGPAELIAEARRHRKLFGGGMRQAGILAAGALYALEHHLTDLADDHRRAQQLAAAIAELPGLSVDPATVDTNIVIFEVAPERMSPSDFCAALRERGVWMFPFGPRSVRAVTHRDLSDEAVERACEVLREVTPPVELAKGDA